MLTREELLEKSVEELVEIIINLYAEIDCMINVHRLEVDGAYNSGGLAGYNDGYSEAEDRFR